MGPEVGGVGVGGEGTCGGLGLVGPGGPVGPEVGGVGGGGGGDLWGPGACGAWGPVGPEAWGVWGPGAVLGHHTTQNANKLLP